VSGLWIWRGGSGRGRAVSVGALAPESVERLRRRGLALAGLTTPQRPERRRMLMVDWMTQHRGGWDDWHDNWDR
jgi:hypothetical protein